MADPAWSVLVRAHPLAMLVVVFLLDGLGIPLMPEIAMLLAFGTDPTWQWGLAIVALAVVLEVLATSLVWGLLGATGMPRRLQRVMDAYAGAMLVSDERLLLVNRFVPVLPVVGAFIRARSWRIGLSLAYVALGSAVKYGLLVTVAAAAYEYFSSAWAFGVSLGLAGTFIAVSWGFAMRRWWVGRREAPETA